MSSIYNLEPQPTASVILHTTLGEISVELFAKQTPLTCRNFLQLALDGYYDNTIFHRLVPNFILQGGDPTGTGNGGESIYDGGAFAGDLDPWPMDQRHGKNAGSHGVNFKDEFHSRLKFNRRGLLAMANESKPDTNGSQFFFTLDKTEELNGKNTLFGRVAGDTIYNLAKIGESEIQDDTDRPLYPVKIQRIEILVNPYEDMKKRSRVAAVSQSVSEAPADQKKKKAKKRGKQLLSFDDDEGGDSELPVSKKKKYDSRIVMEEAEDESPKVTKAPPARRSAKASVQQADGRPVPDRPEHVDDSAEKPEKERQRAQADEPAAKPKSQADGATETPSSSSPTPEAAQPTALEKANEEIAALKASMRRTVHTERPAESKPKSALEQLIPESSMRARKRRPGGQNVSAAEDQRSLNILKAFQSRLDQAPEGKELEPQNSSKPTISDGQEEEQEAELCDLHFIANCQSCNAWDRQENQDSDDEGWMSHSLSFAADKLGKDLAYRKKAEDELVVIDPREKARTLKEEKRAERDARAGKSGRAWDQAGDQARNAQMAKASSLAGRGAK